MKKIWIWFISITVLLVILFVAIMIIRIYTSTVDNFCSLNAPNGVSKIIDGDTFELCSGETVRLLCVDTPEKGQGGYQEATNFLSNTIFLKDITLKPSNYGGNDTDKYGRLLRWVYIANQTTGEEILVNRLILEEGYGDIMIIPPEKCNEVSD
jgi:endonuclease YncB( thermonuclease family)